ncbi:hypothetical protein B0181_06600 [Moraxella caviae]|uniref:Cell division protein ZipA n=2 Tax=Moraxella caviae TaxID=34060 RepID=A0A1T0A1I5_9GAMM|nr:cell division protein ZipA C-terminal FtsZ-binding domain-containing protein [Moraxella caviae]OOR89632.1 hypothetical protein B0181_06600 [Moraxella caviae]STZ10319.1 Cell division protein ZipA [Moraxella caviae]VEW12639.1 Cell division protein ZipA [Moraxella caviae]
MQTDVIWIILALLALVVGAFVVLRHFTSRGSAPAEQGDTQFKDGLPITPRDERELPQTSQDDEDALSSMAAVAASSPVVTSPTVATSPVMNTPADTPSTSAALENAADDLAVSDNAIDAQSQANPSDVEPSAQMQALDAQFEQNSPVLDRHLSAQQDFEQKNDPLLNAETTITIVIQPRGNFASLSGQKVLELVRAYGLKYGAMSMFHRYAYEDGSGDLWFSMLGLDYDGVREFDLNTITSNHFTGVILFLPLPNPHAQRGFDSMVEVAKMMADELDADLLDENHSPLDDVELAKLRAQVINY